MALGTTYDEVRQARAATTADQQALADRLGLRLGDTHPDILDDLLLSPGHRRSGDTGAAVRQSRTGRRCSRIGPV
jgi:hypothetical protein